MIFEISDPREGFEVAKGVGILSSQVSALFSLMNKKQYSEILADCRKNYPSAIFTFLI